MRIADIVMYSAKKDSPFHRLNPLTKAIWWICIIIVPIIITNPVFLLAILLLILGLIKWARIGKDFFNVVKIAYPLLVGFIILVWPFFYRQGTPILGGILTIDGIIYALAMGLRIITSVTGCLFFVMTTDMADLACSAGQFVQEKFGISFTVPFMVISSFKFLPESFATFSNIKDSFACRGQKFDTGGLVQRIKAYVPVFIPLILSFLDKAKQMSIALQIKGFGAEKKRTFLKPNVFTWKDYLFLIIGFLIIAAAFCLRFQTNLFDVFFWRYL
jgi:energy-coupling factor transport system permease protein